MTDFHFRGHCVRCPAALRGEPHLPHRTGIYRTVRYGELERFCPGVAGGPVEIVHTRNIIGDVDEPSVLSGRVRGDLPAWVVQDVFSSGIPGPGFTTHDSEPEAVEEGRVRDAPVFLARWCKECWSLLGRDGAPLSGGCNHCR